MLLKVYRTILIEKELFRVGRTVVKLPDGKFDVSSKNGLLLAKSKLLSMSDDRGKHEDLEQGRIIQTIRNN